MTRQIFYSNIPKRLLDNSIIIITIIVLEVIKFEGIPPKTREADSQKKEENEKKPLDFTLKRFIFFFLLFIKVSVRPNNLLQ